MNYALSLSEDDVKKLIYALGIASGSLDFTGHPEEAQTIRDLFLMIDAQLKLQDQG